jgi:hypothetical protein
VGGHHVQEVKVKRSSTFSDSEGSSVSLSVPKLADLLPVLALEKVDMMEGRFKLFDEKIEDYR